jgi:hypothetical protein
MPCSTGRKGPWSDSGDKVVEEGGVSLRPPIDLRLCAIAKSWPVDRDGLVIGSQMALQWPHLPARRNRAQGRQQEHQRTGSETVDPELDCFAGPPPANLFREVIHLLNSAEVWGCAIDAKARLCPALL